MQKQKIFYPRTQDTPDDKSSVQYQINKTDIGSNRKQSGALLVRRYLAAIYDLAQAQTGLGAGVYLAVFLLLAVAILIFTPTVLKAPEKKGSTEMSTSNLADGVETRPIRQGASDGAADGVQGSSGNDAPKEIVRAPDISDSQFSRMNFFLSSPVRASLAIPADWEGWYLTEETARAIDFLYATPAGEKQILFTIRWFDQGDWNTNAKNYKSSKVLATVDGFVFTVEEGAGEAGSRAESEKYKQMTKEAGLVLSSFKGYKNK